MVNLQEISTYVVTKLSKNEPSNSRMSESNDEQLIA